MKTALLLILQYEGQVVIPISTVVRDYFCHLSPDKFLRKASLGEIKLPIIRMEPGSQKGMKGVHIIDLVAYIEARRDAAEKELKQLY